MIRIRPYKQSDEEKILSWCDSEDTFFKWTFGLLGDYPVTSEKFRKTSEYMQFTAVDDDEPVGYFIARNPNGNLNELRFGYGIVKPDRRDQGVGKEMLRQGLSAEAWKSLVECAQSFSACCCQSSFNYITPEFAASHRL